MIFIVCIKVHLITQFNGHSYFYSKEIMRVESNPPLRYFPLQLPGEIGLKRGCARERVRIQLKSREWWKKQWKTSRVEIERLSSVHINGQLVGRSLTKPLWQYFPHIKWLTATNANRRSKFHPQPLLGTTAGQRGAAGAARQA